MFRYVDIISNDPLGGRQRLLARVSINGGPELDLEIESETETDRDQMWTYLVSRACRDPKTEPIEFLEALPAAIDATYVVASGVHTSEELPPIDISAQ